MIAICLESLGAPDIQPESCNARERWVLLGFSRIDLESPVGEIPRHNSADLTKPASGDCFFPDIEMFVLLDRAICGAFLSWGASVLLEFTARERVAIVLIPGAPSPGPEAQSQCLVTSFACSATVFRELLRHTNSEPADKLCFNLLYAAMNGIVTLDKLLVRQLPEPPCAPAPSVMPKTSVLLPHRGESRHLAVSLHFLSCSGGGHQVRVALDEDETDDHAVLAERHPAAEFFRVQPAPAGPYVIRQRLAQLSPEPLIVLQDSDDVPCSDRFSALYSEMCATGSDLMGSHELRVDEILREVVAIRFPLDVNEALLQRPGHALLHATSMIRRSAFFHVGGLSMDQRVANDTQFLLRASFRLKIRNIDAFLYLRRRHRAALTVHPETANGIPLRLRLDAAWRADFNAICNGQRTVEESSLFPAPSAAEHCLIPVPRRQRAVC